MQYPASCACNTHRCIPKSKECLQGGVGNATSFLLQYTPLRQCLIVVKSKIELRRLRLRNLIEERATDFNACVATQVLAVWARRDDFNQSLHGGHQISAGAQHCKLQFEKGANLQRKTIERVSLNLSELQGGRPVCQVLGLMQPLFQYRLPQQNAVLNRDGRKRIHPKHNHTACGLQSRGPSSPTSPFSVSMPHPWMPLVANK